MKDYNLITICAESFCPWFISEELTPTLYKMTHTGIIFGKLLWYVPVRHHQRRVHHVHGAVSGYVPYKTDSSFNVAGTNYLPLCLGNALKEMGYQT